jgi:hypothetical protein
MNLGKAFTYPFDDPDWMKKLGIAAVMMIIPIVGGLFVMGWAIEITRRVIQGEAYPMPQWEDFMGLLVKGLKVVVISLVYLLPVILVSACTQGLTILGQETGEDIVMTIAMLVSVCFGCLVFLYSLLAGLVMPAAFGKFAATGELKAAFRFGEVISMVRAVPMAYIMVLLGGFVASIIGGLGVIACVIGVLVTIPFANAAMAHLWGQAYREAGGRVQQASAY